MASYDSTPCQLDKLACQFGQLGNCFKETYDFKFFLNPKNLQKSKLVAFIFIRSQQKDDKLRNDHVEFEVKEGDQCKISNTQVDDLNKIMSLASTVEADYTAEFRQVSVKILLQKVSMLSGISHSYDQPTRST